MAIDEKNPIAGLYRLVGHTLEQVLADVRVSNGIIWYGETMYYADSGTFRVDAFHYGAERGELDVESRRTILDSEGFGHRGHYLGLRRDGFRAPGSSRPWQMRPAWSGS
jgi:sugar lactone lactonase YvrE